MSSERDPCGNKSERAVIGIRSDAPVYTAAGPVMAAQASAAQTWEMVRLTGSILGQFVTGQRSIKDMGGPVKIAKQSGELAALGIGRSEERGGGKEGGSPCRSRWPPYE